jgi:hypothetical protein
MKPFVLASTIAFAVISGDAMAVCIGGTRLNAAQITLLLTNNTVCVPAATVPDMTWQELHSSGSGGDLVDFKRGPGHAIDPSETVGSWSVTANPAGNNATVTHNYDSGGTYTYSVFGSGVVGTSHSFCGSAPEIVGRVKSGGGAC